MKKRYILLIIFIVFFLYLVWCNISIVYTQKGKSNVTLVTNTNYQKDSFLITNRTVFWQGFYHDWTFNHRVNRLGDWIQTIGTDKNEFRAVFNHSAASGSGSDVLNYNTFFTFLKTDKARFFSSNVTSVVRGREATTTTKNITIKGIWPAELKNYHNGLVVLNGFDLYCRSSDDGEIMGTGKADKLSHLFMEVNNLRIKGNKFEFDLSVRLGADCDSPECLNFTPGDNEWFDYQFTIAYQVVAFNEAGHIVNSNLSQNYSWRKPFKIRPEIDPNEIFRNNKTLNKQKIQGLSGFNAGIPLINKIDINLPKGKGGLVRKRMEIPHLLDLDIAISDYSYSSLTGACYYNADLFFKNWKPDMHPFSYGNDGKAFINLGVSLLQISDPAASFETQSIEGKINWETTQLDQRQANDPHSIKSFVFVK